MSSQLRFVPKSLLANAALVRFRPTMNQVMLFQVSRIDKCLRADLALSLSLQQMRNVYVPFQILLSQILFATVIVHTAKELEFKVHYIILPFCLTKNGKL